MSAALRISFAKKVLRFGDMLRNACTDIAVGVLGDDSLNVYYRDYYDKVVSHYPLTRAEPEERILSDLLSIAPGRELLDVFCGQGREAKFFSEHGFRVTAIDASEKMIQSAEWHKKAGLVAADFIVADAHTFSPGNRFDVIYLSPGMYGSARGKAARQALLQRLAGMLSPGGVLVLTRERYMRKNRASLWSRYLLQKLVALLTASGASIQRGDRINRYFCHFFVVGELEKEVAESGWVVVSTHDVAGVIQQFVLLKRADSVSVPQESPGLNSLELSDRCLDLFGQERNAVAH